MDSRRVNDVDLRFLIRTSIAVGVVMLCFVLATPRSGGPDEPSHMVVSAALVRGDVTGDPNPSEPGTVLFRVPAMVGDPNPGCWALQPLVPAGCATFQPDRTDDVAAPTTAANYPPWAYVLPGLASFVPAPDAYTYLARSLMMIIPLVLVAFSISSARSIGSGAAAAVLLGMTPIAWFSMTIVNPSAIAIAGGLALWVALLSPRRADALLVAGWIALLLPRRDGPLWATLIVLAVCGALTLRPSDLWRSRPARTRWILVAVVPVPFITAVFNGLRDVNLVLALAPIGLVVVDAALRFSARLQHPAHRVAFGVACALAVAVTVMMGLAASPGGFDADVARLVASNTGEHLRQLVGVLSWLDAPVPTFAVYLFWAAIGGLTTLALLEMPRIAATGLGVVLAAVVTAWILELGQGSGYGRYWQGRYSMPFVVGLALLLSIRAYGRERPVVRSSGQVDVLAPLLGIVAWIILNVGFAAALQRWGVGSAGSWLPWEWSTYSAPVPPWLLLITCAAASGWLVKLATAPRTSEQTLPSN